MLPIPLAHNIQHVQLSKADLDIIQGSVECDLVYSTIYCLTCRGWPEHRQDIPCIAWHFWGTRDELPIDSGLLLKGTRVCIPPELLDRTFADLHGVHQGVNRMQAQVIEAVHWPGIDADISDYVNWHTICTKHKTSPPAHPMLPRDTPDGPWQDIAANYMTHNGQEYLIICDAFSKYPFAYKTTTKSAQSLCACLLELISQYGPPSMLYTDNGLPFASEELTEFLTCQCIEHSTSSPHFPRSNGFIECQIRTIKTALNTALPAKNPWDCSTGPHINSNQALHAFTKGDSTTEPPSTLVSHLSQLTWRESGTSFSPTSRTSASSLTRPMELVVFLSSP